ncbi:3-oxosteroid 1-dehydrogenase [Actinoplanes lutulentus]|uniref:3-oxosteroid 1-dehydrogenase n=1 Tax=Actinoplanes lutulentus TaxID=1287878 RepID=A0A327ZAY2_9ACTN|nr:FAD-dependent oxidoreductase [Actinoplanes lutulentus]MBB2941355.1 3-oxosteroid 1-dehydrogenase [Actinoplanes lutulentus]RAK36847.1 3-oxosteroid 1-dehydrogenase [Actinoplanes lutulentus]
MSEIFDREVDVLVVGTGAAGLTAAIAAADAGAKVLVVESTGKWGGTTALSGGGLWMPTNPLIRGEDSVEKALTYMQEAIGDVGPASSPERRRAFVETVPEVFELLRSKGVRWVASHDYPDYYPDRPGGMVGRGIEVEPFDTKKLGEWFETFRGRDSMPAPLKTDDVWLLSRAWSTPSGFVRGAQFVFRTLFGLATGKRLFGIGSALTASLFGIVREQGTSVLLNTPLTELIVEDGAIVGAVAGEMRIKTRNIILGAGGFARNTEWREKHHGTPGFTSAADGDLGDPIRLAAEAGATLDLMDDAWWGASVPLPDGHHQFVLSERSMPYSIVVDQQGDRYTNESASYIDFGHAMLERSNAIPSWLILDTRHRRRYLFNAFLTGTKKLRSAGIVRSAATLEELAGVLSIEPARLRATVDRFNGFARSGVDEDFGRGRTVYDNYYGDPTVKPNPNLGTIEKGPFTAVQLVPGDLGTKGGLLTDENGAVVGVSGLYAAGNTTASVMGRTYPGPGSTIAPAVVFGYRAGRAAATSLVNG